MFENLAERLETAFKKLKGQGKISEINVSETLKEVRKVLMDADVEYKVANNFIKVVKDKAMGQKVINSVKPKELLIRIVHDELKDLMGGVISPIKIEGNPSIILMSGLQGSGKTTFSAKLAKKLRSSKGRTPLLVAADVYRPAAIQQLKVLGESIDVPVYAEEDNKNPVEIASNAIKHAKSNHYDLVIVDTAGRLAIDEQMMNEIAAIKEAIKPQETLFVVDSMTGQDAINTAREFNQRLNFDGVVLTKLDGDTKGGAAVSIRTVVDKPIKLVGSGEKLDDIEEFDPEGMASRILGMGDIVALVRKAESVYNEEEARKIEERIRKNKFDYNDFYKQIQQIKKMGNMKHLASLIPGVGKQIKNLDLDDDMFKGIEAIINSMTPYERENPDKIVGSRRQRIAKGSGKSIQEVNNMIKRFEEMRKLMHLATTDKGKAQKMMQRMQQQQTKTIYRR